MLALREFGPSDRQALKIAFGNADLILNAKQPPDGVLRRRFCGFINKTIVGTLNIRTNLDDFHLVYGGHIGYTVIPAYRKNGYATEMLRQALIICNAMKIDKVLITCDNINSASIRVIEKNGGVLEAKIVGKDGQVVRRYWIKLK